MKCFKKITLREVLDKAGKLLYNKLMGEMELLVGVVLKAIEDLEASKNTKAFQDALRFLKSEDYLFYIRRSDTRYYIKKLIKEKMKLYDT